MKALNKEEVKTRLNISSGTNLNTVQRISEFLLVRLPCCTRPTVRQTDNPLALTKFFLERTSGRVDSLDSAFIMKVPLTYCVFNPFPHLLTPWETSLLKTVGKGEIARNEQFLLFPQCFLPVWITCCHFRQI